ncbi:helix-turn-helix transcriptional regulator [Leucobacter chromiireducens]|uniref:helix-turn-helix transcriptional regulator n=1 Tax=Leucobacter chromiireducens TaxID=283877 RepID=UPI003F7E1AC9
MAAPEPTPLHAAPQLLTIDELAELLQVSTSTIYSHRSLGLPLPPAAKICGRLRWRLSDVEAFIANQFAEAA